MDPLSINDAVDDAIGLPSVKILVACRQRIPLLQTGVFTPIHVGRAIASEQAKCDLERTIGDDTGDNISVEHTHFGELTAAYWAWKNAAQLGNPEYIGLVRQQRLFNFRKDLPGSRSNWLFDDFSSASRYRFGWDDDCIRNFCRCYDAIVDKPRQIDKHDIVAAARTDGLYTPALARSVRRLPDHPTLYQYGLALGHKADLDLALRIIKNIHPGMAQAVDWVMGGKTAYSIEAFIMKRRHFEEFCRQLFGILAKMAEDLVQTDAGKQDLPARTSAFVAERFLEVYLEHGRLSASSPLIVKECQVLSANPRTIDDCSLPPQERPPRDRVAVALATDDGYAEQTGVAVTSILMNCDRNTHCHIHILDAGLSAENKRRFEQLKRIRPCDISFRTTAELANQYDFDGYVRKGALPWATAASFHRLLLPSLLPEVDRVLYLDGDTIVRKDLAPLFRTELDGNYVGMASDVYARANLIPHEPYFRAHLGVGEEYFNAGVTLFDLAGMRRDGIEKALLDYLAAHGPFKFIDQDLLNAALKGKIRRLDQTWNMTQGCWNFDSAALPRREVNHIVQCRADPAIVHYAGDAKPWNHFGGRYRIPRGDDYWHYRELSPWNDLARKRYDEECPCLSVIIPTRNVAEHLPHCLRTVMDQTLRNIEIIVVDAGSSDRSAEIAEACARRDGRIKVLRKEHGDASAARNAGLAVARGEYIGFVEGDHSVDAEMFEKLYHRAGTTKSDVVISDAWLSFPDGSRQYLRDQRFFSRNRDEVFSALEAPEAFWCEGACDKIYRRSLLRDNQIVFRAGLVCGDPVFGFEALAKAKRIALVWEQLYHYRPARTESTAQREAADDDAELRYVETMRTTKRHFLEHGNYNVFLDAILPVQFLFATRDFRSCTSQSSAREFFGRLRSVLDQGDYASLSQIGHLDAVEPVSILARHLAGNDFTGCYYRVKCVTMKKRMLQSALRVMPAAARLKAVAAASRLLPNRAKGAIVRILPARVMRALTQP